MRKADAVAAAGGIEDQLDAEAREDESARRQYGGRWPLAASYVASGELRDRLSGYRHAAPCSWAAQMPCLHDVVVPCKLRLRISVADYPGTGRAVFQGPA